MKYLKGAARPLNREYINRRGLDLSNEVLWVSVSQKWRFEKNAARSSAGELYSNPDWAQPCTGLPLRFLQDHTKSAAKANDMMKH